jgi:hypothetical protein
MTTADGDAGVAIEDDAAATEAAELAAAACTAEGEYNPKLVFRRKGGGCDASELPLADEVPALL